MRMCARARTRGCRAPVAMSLLLPCYLPVCQLPSIDWALTKANKRAISETTHAHERSRNECRYRQVSSRMCILVLDSLGIALRAPAAMPGVEECTVWLPRLIPTSTSLWLSLPH